MNVLTICLAAVRAACKSGHFCIHCILTSLTLHTVALHAQWVQTNGPLDGLATCYLETDQGILVGSEHGNAYFSTDNGDSWQPIQVDNERSTIVALQKSGSLVFAATASGGVLRSSDQGFTWKRTIDGMPSIRLNGLIVVNGRLLAASVHNGIFVSTNDGTTWRTSNSGFPEKYCGSLMANGSTVYALSESKLYRSPDTGSTWSLISTLPHGPFYSLLSFGKDLYAAGHGALMRSTNGGVSWIDVDTSLWSTNLYMLTRRDSILYACSDKHGLLVSSDSGKSWIESNTGLTSPKVYSVTVVRNHLFAGTNSGLFRSADYGKTWSAVGFISSMVTSIHASDSFVYAAAWNAGVYRTSNRGSSWTSLTNGAPQVPYLDICTRDSLVYIVTLDGTVYLSRNYGDSWTEISNTIKVGTAMTMLGKTLVVGGFKGIAFTTNMGADW